MNSIIKDFKNRKEKQPVTPEQLIEEHCKAMFKLPYPPKNQGDVKTFIKKVKFFDEDKWQLTDLWSSRNI